MSIKGKERRQLAWAMFESIPYEHRLGSHIYGGRTWGGECKIRNGKADHPHVGLLPTVDYYGGDTGGAFGRHYADN